MNIKKILQGDRPSLARAISLIENEASEANELLASLYPHLGKAHRIGVTGPPGVGKSTLVNELARTIRQKEQTIGIVAIDPTSIFSGGAILGDRIRMQKIGMDKGVFIRSMATRGGRGGIAQATSEVADLLDATGKNYVIIETVGVGQSEVEIFKNVDTTILILSPESGDAIQAMKAGIMEIADIIIVNKADRPGADALINNIRNTLEISKIHPVRSKTPKASAIPLGWTSNGARKEIPILKTEAINSVGLDEVLTNLEDRWEHLKKSGKLEEKRSQILKDKLKSLVTAKLEKRLWDNKEIDTILNKSIDKIMQGKDTPHKAVERIIKLMLKG